MIFFDGLYSFYPIIKEPGLDPPHYVTSLRLTRFLLFSFSSALGSSFA